MRSGDCRHGAAYGVEAEAQLLPGTAGEIGYLDGATVALERGHAERHRSTPRGGVVHVDVGHLAAAHLLHDAPLEDVVHAAMPGARRGIREILPEPVIELRAQRTGTTP